MGLELADVLLQEEQVEREVVPVAVRLGQDAHGGQQLVDLQEVGVAVAEERAETGVDNHGDEGDEDHQVDQAVRQSHMFDVSLCMLSHVALLLC